MSTKPSGTREQIAVGEWLDRAALVRANLVTTANSIPTILPYFDFLSDSIACFGRCELEARSLDRAVEMDLFAERREWLSAEVKRHNEAGLSQIENLRGVFSQMGKDLTKLKFDRKKMLPRLDECVKEFRLAIAEWDMKGSDAKKIDVVLQEIVDVVREKGLIGLPDYLDGKMAELQDVRRRDDRGAIDNIPWWKIIIIAGMIGWWIIMVLWCNAFGCKPASVVFWWAIQAIHLVAFVLFC